MSDISDDESEISFRVKVNADSLKFENRVAVEQYFLLFGYRQMYIKFANTEVYSITFTAIFYFLHLVQFGFYMWFFF